MAALLQEQRRTNKLLQGIIYAAIGFLFGLVLMQIVWQMRVFGVL
jgi:ubiquinone biosynthesis protein